MGNFITNYIKYTAQKGADKQLYLTNFSTHILL